MSIAENLRRSEVLLLCRRFADAELAYLRSPSELNSAKKSETEIRLEEAGISLVNARYLAASETARQYLGKKA